MSLWARLTQTACLWHLPIPVPVNESLVQSMEGNVTNHYIWVYITLLTHKLNSELSGIWIRFWLFFLLGCVNMPVWPWYWFYRNDRSLKVQTGLQCRTAYMYTCLYVSFRSVPLFKCPSKGKPLVLCKHADQSLFFNMLHLNFISLCARLAERWGTHQHWQIDLSVRMSLYF